MPNSIYKVPSPKNEKVLSYKNGSKEKKLVLLEYKKMLKEEVEVPLYIGKGEIFTGDTEKIFPPHDHNHNLGIYHKCNSSHVKDAINNSLRAKKKWSKMPWYSRASIFLKAAELISGPYRAKINAATMLGQSKTAHQAEIDSACELIDFLRFNVYYMQEIYMNQPESSSGIWNRLDYRPLEGFVYAISPFNFTAIAGNLSSCVAMMGNVVIWKPSDFQVLSAKIIIDIFKEAGLPDGVINVIFGDPEMITNSIIKSKDLSGIHYTGSTEIFKSIWKKIGKNINLYKTYPRIVGETGGKDFIIAHPSANKEALVSGIIRGAFEYQGQKCSAASRIYIPKSISKIVLNLLKKEIKTLKMGSPENFKNFITSVIHKKSYERIKKTIDKIKKDEDAEIIIGGNCNSSKGYFIEPTIVLTTNPKYFTMEKELFGPVATVYIFEDKDWELTLKLVNETSIYALTGAIFSQERYIIEKALKRLKDCAGNFYINDKPTGAVVGQQPFGGARASGTNDKAGSLYNLLRWTSPRLIKETFIPEENYRYPFLE